MPWHDRYVVPIRWNKRGLSLAAIVTVLVIAGIVWMQFAGPGGGAAILTHLPTRDAAVGHVDIRSIREAGFVMSANASALREPEYEDFIKRSGFNWEKDLDRITWSFAPTAKFFLVEGRFDWKRLSAFAVEEGGECRDGFCTVRGSQTGREISFFPLRNDVMALAVSADRYAADQLRSRHEAEEGHPIAAPPKAPLWVHFSKFSLSSAEPESPGLRGFARVLRNTEESTLVLEPTKDSFLLRLDARCSSAETAQSLATDLTKLTALLQSLLRMEQATPGEGDFASVLAQGSFQAEASQLHGSWPISRAFLAGLFTEP